MPGMWVTLPRPTALRRDLDDTCAASEAVDSGFGPLQYANGVHILRVDVTEASPCDDTVYPAEWRRVAASNAKLAGGSQVYARGSEDHIHDALVRTYLHGSRFGALQFCGPSGLTRR